jgi:hypothetical protein
MVRYGLPTLAVLLIGCQNTTAVGVNRTFQMVVYGSVIGADGSAISSANIRITPVSLTGVIQGTSGRCGGTVGNTVSTVAGQDGKFSAVLHGAGGPTWLCLNIEATGQSNGIMVARTLAVDSVLLGPPGVGRDSVAVQMIF